MPNLNTPPGPKHTGWFNDKLNNKLELYYNGTKLAEFDATHFDPVVAMTPTGAVTATGAVSSSGLVTGGTGLVATTGGVTATAGDVKATVGNFRAGVLSTFGTTEPTSAVVLKLGTAPVGAITTSSGIFASSTVMRKIIADGTASNVET